MTDLDLDELRSELHDFAQPEKKVGRSAREERIIAGFEEIQRFVEKHGHAPQYGEDRDIFERLYAVRLDRLRALEKCRSLLAPLDHQGLLAKATAPAAPAESMDDEELLAELEGAAGSSDITELRHVRTSADKRAAEEIANRQTCEDFDRFQPLFQQVQQEIESGVRETRPFELKAEIRPGSWFIVGGQKAYVADMGDVPAGSWRLVPLGSGISLARLSFVRIGSCQGDDPRLTRPTVHAGTLNPGTNPYQSRWWCEPRRRGGAALMKCNGAQDRWLLSDRVGD